MFLNKIFIYITFFCIVISENLRFSENPMGLTQMYKLT